MVGNCECEFNPILAIGFDDARSYGENSLWMRHALEERFGLQDRHKYLRRQALPQFYRANGSMYVVKVKRFEVDRDIYDENCYAYVMPQENSIDVDTELDFVIAEAVMKHFGR